MAPGVSAERQQTALQTELSTDWRPHRPNILVSGTPGVGKTTISRRLAEELGLRHIEVGEFARERNLLGDHDALHEAFYMDEDGVLDELEPIMADGGVILDHHSCDWYPERWIQLAVVLRAGTEVLYDRLEARGYSRRKLDDNMQAEIMQVVYEEAVTSYPRISVMELRSDTEEDQQRILQVVKQRWRTLATPERSSELGSGTISATTANELEELATTSRR